LLAVPSKKREVQIKKLKGVVRKLRHAKNDFFRPLPPCQPPLKRDVIYEQPQSYFFEENIRQFLIHKFFSINLL